MMDQKKEKKIDKKCRKRKRKFISKEERLKRKRARAVNALREPTVEEKDSLKRALETNMLSEAEKVATACPRLRCEMIYKLFEMKKNKAAFHYFHRYLRLDEEFEFPIVDLLERLRARFNPFLTIKVLRQIHPSNVPSEFFWLLFMDLITDNQMGNALDFALRYSDLFPYFCQKLFQSENSPLLTKICHGIPNARSLTRKQVRFLRNIVSLSYLQKEVQPKPLEIYYKSMDSVVSLRSKRIVQKLQALLDDEIVLFGSRSIPALYDDEKSDLDVLCAKTNISELSRIASLLQNSPSFKDIELIQETSVPLVSFFDSEEGIRVDLSSCENLSSLINSRILSRSAQVLWYFPLLLKSIRRWVFEQRLVSGSEPACQFNKFSWDILVVFFLQQLGCIGEVKIISRADVSIEKSSKEIEETVDIANKITRFWKFLATLKTNCTIDVLPDEHREKQVKGNQPVIAVIDPGTGRCRTYKVTALLFERIRALALWSYLNDDNIDRLL